MTSGRVQEPKRPSSRTLPPATVAQRLLRSSATHSYDPDQDIDWTAPLDEDLWFLSPELVSLYGTPLWQEMDERRRRELSRHEMASYFSAAWWLELAILRMFSRYLNGRDPMDPRTHYALTEVGDETRHMRMFARLLDVCGCPFYPPPPRVRRLFPVGDLLFQDVSTFALALVFEESADQVQRISARDDRVQPLVRQVFSIHVAEEARHVSFARAELREAVRGASAARVAFHRELTGFAAALGAPARISPRVYEAVGLDTAEAVRQVRGSRHAKETQAGLGESLIPFLTEIGLITGRQHHWWRRSGLMV